MGTRSTTLFTETCDGKSENLLALYRQMDGYPSGHGKDLAEILQSFTFVNGLGMTDSNKVANGPGCAVAQIVTEIKDGPGGIYVIPCNKNNYDNDYHYHVDFKPDTDNRANVEVSIRVYRYGSKRNIFSGSLDKFAAWCAKNKD